MSICMTEILFPVGLLVRTASHDNFHKIHGVIDILIYLGHAQKVEVSVRNVALDIGSVGHVWPSQSFFFI